MIGWMPRVFGARGPREIFQCGDNRKEGWVIGIHLDGDKFACDESSVPLALQTLTLRNML